VQDRMAATESIWPCPRTFVDLSPRANPSRSGRSRAINIAVGALRSTANGKLRLPRANSLRLEWINKLKVRFSALKIG